MSPDPSETAAEPVLRFDRAEFAEGEEPARCGACGEVLYGTYYDVNGAMTCERCRSAIELSSPPGSPATRFMRSMAAGLAAAAVGAGIYYGVRAVTGGWEFGLIAIVVGLMVGGAVRWGSYGRGGWRYQALAIGLTYLSIVSTYAPFVLEAFRQLDDEPAAAAATSPSQAAAPAPTPGARRASAPTASTAGPPAESDGVAKNGSAKASSTSLSTSEIVVGLGAIGFVFLAAPFLAGFENFMGWIILGIGLYEAWKINRRRPLVITGPFQLGRRPVETAPA